LKPIVVAVYLLEGKGPVALVAYDIIKGVKNWFEFHSNDLTYPGLVESMEEFENR
jgi:hypothetical protein